MATIAEMLTTISSAKSAIKKAIISKGVAVPDNTPLSDYAGKIGSIESGSSGDIDKYKSALAGIIQRNVANIVVPAGPAIIGSNAFEDGSSIVSIEFEPGLKEIEDAAFYACSNLRSLTLPATITSICDTAFYGAKTIKTINIKSLKSGAIPGSPWGATGATVHWGC